MVLQSMGTQYNIQGPGLTMVDQSTLQEIVFSGSYPLLENTCQGSAVKSSDQKSEVHQFSGSHPLRTQEELRQEEGNPLPVQAKQFFQVRTVQKADYFSDTNPTTP